MGSELPTATVSLPAQLSEAFRMLRKGQHVCRDDGPVWFDLRDNPDAYRTIFTALGYTLSDHPRGFYFFSEGQQSRPEVLSRLVYFFTCLFSDLDQGRYEPGIIRWVDTLADHEFSITVLADGMFSANDRQRIFSQLQVSPDNFEKAVIAPLCRYGIATRAKAGSLRFRQGVYRFVEFFQTCADDSLAPTAVADTAGNELTDTQSDLDEEDGEVEQ